MISAPKSMRAQIDAWLWSVVVVDALILLGFTYPTLFDHATPLAAAAFRLCAAAIAPVVVLMLTSLLPSNIKAVLVFWRVCDPLPGHRAFSLHAPGDSRIDLQALRNNIGEFPNAPREQNTLWYRLYKKVETEVTVTLAHRHYLLFRDLAALSLLLVVFAPLLLFFAGASNVVISFSLCFFAIQYFAAALAARNHGIGLVTNVLALHASKKD